MHDTRLDQRYAPRRHLQVFVDEGVAPGTGTLCRAVNVSRTGMFLLRVPAKRPATKFVWLGFQLPDGGQTIRALAEVLRTQSLGSLEGEGVRFKYLHPRDRQRLDAFLEAPRPA
jgi:hypothetical protein